MRQHRYDRRELVRLLAAAGAPTRAVLRDAGKAQSLPRRAIRWPAARRSAIWRSRPIARQRVLHLAVLKPDPRLRMMGGAESRELHHEQTSMRWTVLRPHAFMQNWLGDLAESVRTANVIESPIGEGRVPFIDARDIAAVAAEILLRPETHQGKKYVLTGGEAVGFRDLAAALAEVTGRPVRYRAMTMEEARERLERRGVPRDQIDAQLAIAAYQKAGGPTSVVSDHVRQILGRSPRTIRNFVDDYAEAFSTSGE